MGVLSTSKYMHVAEQRTAEAILGQHAAYGCFHNALRVLGQFQGGRAETLASGVARVADVLLGLHLGTRKAHFSGIDNNYIVTAIRVRSIVGLVLTAKA